MTNAGTPQVAEARAAALEVLRHNARGPFQGLPRTAGWGYPEPYVRDLMIAALGVTACGDGDLIQRLGQTLSAIAQNQSRLGHIPSLAHDPQERGASDTTPLFLIGLYCYRQAAGDPGFLKEAAGKALTWMEYQSPEDLTMVAQMPTSDWRDEHWVLGFGLYVNCLAYTYLRLFGRHPQARVLHGLMNRFHITAARKHRHVHEGLAMANKPYYALWSYKMYNNERFDLLGNSLAILSGVASAERAREIVAWVEAECAALRQQNELSADLPPCLMPFMRLEDPDWQPRYAGFNQPGEYHNGGIWPFICGFYVAALVAADRHDLAHRKLEVLTEMVKPAREQPVNWGFNEWFKAQDGTPQGQDWQTWSAAMYLYASECVARARTPCFDLVRADR